MTFPEWVKPSSYGAICGAIAISIIGFTWGNWTTSQTAEEMAKTMAKKEVVLAMVPVCLIASAADPERRVKMETISNATSFNRKNAMMATGWATFPGSDTPNKDLAVACIDELNIDG